MIESSRNNQTSQYRTSGRYTHIPPGYNKSAPRTFRAPTTETPSTSHSVNTRPEETMRQDRAQNSLRHRALHNAGMHNTHNAHTESRPSTATGNHAQQPRVKENRPEDKQERSGSGYKERIGPWKLGQVLGKGASAEVRLCRHSVTQQQAACKIVSKCSSKLVQAGSLAALDRIDTTAARAFGGQSRVPVAVEREVAILKLIQHPNIVKLYDIWENKKDIYLILELVDDGDLFNFITQHGRLSENTAIGIFRQIMSAMTYCHAFKICHRDLKPENILVTNNGHIKITDFGMAALHQTESHKLHTACGSPHYAAPELLWARPYYGHQADIWSMGVILFAMLTARLPFDEVSMVDMLAKTKRGEYTMPEFLSSEAKDLIRRMLEINPEKRISMYDMWRHPLIMRYQAYDNINPVTGQPPEVSLEFHPRPLERSEVNGSIVRQLRTLWHMFEEEDIIRCLTDETPSAQQAFYWLLQEYLEQQRENFTPDIPHSRSEYHHLAPATWRRKVSTCEFTSGANVSRFTVISQVPDSESDTLASYDPYNVNSYSQRPSMEASSTKVTIRRGPSCSLRKDASFASNATRMRRTGNTMASLHSNRGGSRVGPRTTSIGSMHSGKGVKYARTAVITKRPVNFTNIRRKSLNQGTNASGRDGQKRQYPPGTHHQRRRPTVHVPKSAVMSAAEAKDTAFLEAQIRDFRSRIVMDIDTAFNSSTISETSSIMSPTGEAPPSTSRKSHDPITPISYDSNADTLVQDSTSSSWQERPLPSLPPGDTAMGKQTAADAALRMARAKALERSNTNVQVLRAESNASPVMDSPQGRPGTSAGKAQMSHRQSGRADKNGFEFLVQAQNTIRVVNSPKRPLTGSGFMDRFKERKRDSRSTVQQSRPNSPLPNHEYVPPEPVVAVTKQRKLSWFQRLSSYTHTSDMVETGTRLSQSVNADAVSETSSIEGERGVSRKKSGLMFWKNGRDSEPPRQSYQLPLPSRGQDSGDPVQESWISRMFNVKAAKAYMCLELSDRDARLSLCVLFRQWKSFGVEIDCVDKKRNIVHAHVSEENEVKIKPVSFSAEVIKTIEHGCTTPLCIVRFKQEQGSASAFHWTIKTIKEVYKRRGTMVKDKRKRRMMVHTLTAKANQRGVTSG